jgi:hypothetical protein
MVTSAAETVKLLSNVAASLLCGPDWPSKTNESPFWSCPPTTLVQLATSLARPSPLASVQLCVAGAIRWQSHSSRGQTRFRMRRGPSKRPARR